MKTPNWITGRRKLADLVPFDKNPRKVTKQAISKMVDRIKKRGFHDVIKIDTNGVMLSGHVRKEALTLVGIEEVNVLIPDRKLTEEERDKVVLESNIHDGVFDMEMLPEFGQEVLLDVGFETSEVDTLMGDHEDDEDFFDSDKALKEIKTPMTQYGDMYKLGDSMLICDDSTKEADVRRLMHDFSCPHCGH